MAAAIPIVASFFSVSAGVAAGMTLSGFLLTAGGILTGIGALTGKKDLLKIGGLMSLGGAAAGALSGAASSASGSASPAWDAAGSAAGSDAAQLGKYGLGQQATALGDSADVLSSASGAAATTEPSTGILGYAQRIGSSGAQPAAAASGTATPAAQSVVSQYVDPVTAAGSTMDSGTMNSILQSAWDKTKALGAGLGDFARNNKELLQLGGGIVQSMYGPDAERLTAERDTMNRRIANLNAPVRLGMRQLGQGA